MAVDLLRKSSMAHLIYSPDHEEFQESRESYWSVQERELAPAVIIKPETATDVATAVKILHEVNVANTFNTPFAIRSRGHQAYPGSANIESGIAIDLRRIDQVSVSNDRSLVTAGAGASFEKVYNFLEPLKLNVPGARVAQVGVGGFTLGGGISYYAPKVGLTCDNVDNFQVVLADGSIVDANHSENSDLFKALKGGGNNFGIVTAVTFRTMELEDLWGGAVFYEPSQYRRIASELHDQASSVDYDKNAAIFIAICHMSIGQIATASLKYTKPVKDPPALHAFTSLPSLQSSLKTGSLAQVSYEGEFALPGERRLYMTCSFTTNKEMLQRLEDIWRQTLQDVLHVAGIEWCFVINPILPNTIREGQKHGGNVLGLPSDKTVIVVLVMGKWDRVEDDDAVIRVGSQTCEKIRTQATDLGVFHPYVYMNYAWKNQPVIDGYGDEAKKFLQGVSRKYDPDQLFQRAVPGGFKLFTRENEIGLNN